MVLRKPPMEWDKDDLQSLIDNKVEESLYVEYKRQLNLDKPRDRKEIAKDVSAFANASGGIIIYGIEEEGTDDSPPIPTSLNPINEPELEKLEDILLSSTAPRMEFTIHPIRVDGGYCVVLEIPPSYSGPHMVTLGADNRYYKRRNYQAFPMSEEEIRTAYLRAAQSLSTIRERYIRIRLTPPDDGRCWTQILAVPLYEHDLLINPSTFDTALFDKPIDGAFNPTIIYRGRPRPGPYGLELFGPNRKEYNYALRLTESGHLETVMAYGFPGDPERYLPSLQILHELHDVLLLFGRIYQAVGYFGPTQIYYRLFGITDSRLTVPPSFLFRPGPIQEQEWERTFSTNVWTMIQSPLEITRYFMNLVWNAYGYSRCFLFDKDGILVQE